MKLNFKRYKIVLFSIGMFILYFYCIFVIFSFYFFIFPYVFIYMVYDTDTDIVYTIYYP